SRLARCIGLLITSVAYRPAAAPSQTSCPLFVSGAGASPPRPAARNGFFISFGENCRQSPGAETASAHAPWDWGLRPMKSIVLLLSLLAAVKLAHQEYLFRSATREAILGAYRGHAAEACQREARTQAPGLSAQAWASPAAVELLIGKPGLD